MVFHFDPHPYCCKLESLVIRQKLNLIGKKIALVKETWKRLPNLETLVQIGHQFVEKLETQCKKLGAISNLKHDRNILKAPAGGWFRMMLLGMELLATTLWLWLT